MPDEPELKDPELYEKLREEGNSKEKAARISNAAAKEGRSAVGRRGGESGSYDSWTVDDLRKRAKELGLHGYSDKTKHQLIEMLRDHWHPRSPYTPHRALPLMRERQIPPHSRDPGTRSGRHHQPRRRLARRRPGRHR